MFWAGKIQWLQKKKVRTKGTAEILIRWRLRILKDLTEFVLNLRATFVPSEKNKAGALTRIKKNWMKSKEGTTSVCCLGYEDLKELQFLLHIAVERTLYLVVTKEHCTRISQKKLCIRYSSCNLSVNQSTPQRTHMSQGSSTWPPNGSDWL